ncbi:hypothetical protein CO659_12600 [Rhizobium sp. S9]|uniref:hypothetical protein n=1 Tax=Rhizobium sp. S9 TaxID=2035454 RepID=UPI000BE80B1F|nr:hypothetical protein [Rhizobium sp. S9]PDS97499.1 hypothetical protein CO659_12600 [Rhizobium sp. S9]
MSPADMEKLCLENIEAGKNFGIAEEKANITLVTPKGWRAPPKFPRGHLLQVKENGDRLWHFPSKRVLAWVRAAAKQGGAA